MMNNEEQHKGCRLDRVEFRSNNNTFVCHTNQMMLLADYERMPRGLGAPLVDQLDLDASSIRVRKKVPANNGGGFRSPQHAKNKRTPEERRRYY
jgi:hypothetical protein